MIGAVRSMGRVNGLVLAALVLGSSAGWASSAAERDTSWSFERFFREFRGQRLDPAHCAAVASLLIQRDVASFALEEGQLVLATPIGGRIAGAAFTGRGSFAFAPASEVEREQLRRLFGTPVLRVPFDQLALIFNDSTEAELTASAHFGPGRPAHEAELALQRVIDDLSHAGTQHIDHTLASSLLERRVDGHFFAAVHPLKGRSLFLEIDPWNGEEVILSRNPEGPPVGGVERVSAREILSQLRREGRSSEELDGDSRRELTILHIAADLRIDHYTDLRATARLRGVTRADRASFLAFQLYDQLVVDSVRVDGRITRWARGRGSNLLWAQCTPPLERGDSIDVAVSYHGPVIKREGNQFWLAVEQTWLPLHQWLTRCTYDLTFHYPSDLQLASIRDRVSTTTQGGVTTARWLCDQPVQYACFNLGFMKEHQVEVAGIPAVTVLMNSEDHRERARELAEEAVGSGKDMEKQVGADVANSLAFFQSVYGPLPLRRLYATETPIAHGVSFPGMIALYTGTFQSNERYGEAELFRSHEVAHQWWPYGVGMRTYHDVWLSEGLAEFSALWFLQASAHDNQRYFQVLEAWRKDILEGQRQKLGSGLRVAPTWLGTRAAVNAQDGAYQTAVYEKGAWVLHMLRNLLLDLDSMRDDRFEAVMKDYYQAFRGQEASTQDFRRVAEKHAGRDLGWFFQQWVYRTDVPTYRFAWKAEPAAGGKVRVRCRVEQRDVPDDFQMSVPILIDLGDRGHARIRAEVRGPTTEFELPLMDATPRQVVFDDLSSVLCEVENVDWR